MHCQTKIEVMKKTLSIATAMVVVSYTCAQKISGDKVLASVKTAFQKRYPNANKTTDND